MSETRKTLVRYPAGVKVTSARTHVPNRNEPTAKVTKVLQIPSCGENILRYESTPISGRCYQSMDGATAMEREANEGIKKLNIPFDEVVYQDLISLNDVGMKIKSDEFIKFDDRPRRQRKMDPEPNLKDFYQPTKHKTREFLYCDFACKTVGLGGGNFKKGFRNVLTPERRDSVSYDFAYDANYGNESEKLPGSEEFDLENNAAGIISMKKRIEMHGNYGLDPPKLRSYFNGYSLFERSRNWKV